VATESLPTLVPDYLFESKARGTGDWQGYYQAHIDEALHFGHGRVRSTSRHGHNASRRRQVPGLEREARVVYLHNWLDDWRQILSHLPAILEMPDGPDRLITLQTWEGQVSTSDTVDTGRLRELRTPIEELYPGVQGT
jgi:hypothetical protein